jgi:hypothetical protein
MKRLILGLGLFALLAPVTIQAGVTRQHAAGMVETGTGKVSPTPTPGCATLAQGCMSTTGTFRGKPLTGSYSAVFTAFWTGSKCAHAGGTVVLQGKNGKDSLTLDEGGIVCKVSSGVVAYHFKGSYSITSGSGIYATSGTGTGKASFDLLRSGNKVRMSEVGGFSLTERPPI